MTFMDLSRGLRELDIGGTCISTTAYDAHLPVSTRLARP